MQGDSVEDALTLSYQPEVPISAHVMSHIAPCFDVRSNGRIFPFRVDQEGQRWQLFENGNSHFPTVNSKRFNFNGEGSD